MKSYKVYLTKSSEVASRIKSSFQIGGEIQSLSSGKVNENTDLVPTVYHDKGFYYCTVTLNENGEHDAPTYELIIC
ncbi:MAG: hypothetical protein FWE08_03365 [Oscillospiraceae bacterium]|nr:hypothetical protein [Oscillospiraceae bacterium]